MLDMKFVPGYPQFMIPKDGWRTISTRNPPLGHWIMHVRLTRLLPLSYTQKSDRPDDDHAVAVLTEYLTARNPRLTKSHNSSFFDERSKLASYSLFNPSTGFMEARNANGSWAGQDEGWTEGDMWAYTFDVVQDVDGLIERRGGKKQFVEFLDSHFDGGESTNFRYPWKYKVFLIDDLVWQVITIIPTRLVPS